MAKKIKHWTDEAIDQAERAKILSANDVRSWICWRLTEEETALDLCITRIDQVVMLRAEHETEKLRLEYSRLQSEKGELKANVRGFQYVLDAFDDFQRKAVLGYLGREHAK